MAFPLRNGVQLPAIGLGTYKATGSNLVQAVDWALEAGLTHIDSATAYKNGPSIYEGVTRSGRQLSDVFITSKVGPRSHGYAAALTSCERALDELKTDTIDLMLIHWPGMTFRARKNIPQIVREETWSVLEQLYSEGKFRAIGVSNYEVIHLEEMMRYATVKPMVNQIEVHPRFPNTDVREYCKQHGIQVVAYASLGTGDLVNHRTIVNVAQRIGKTPAQVLLKWGLQQDMAVIPKSITKERIQEWSPEKLNGWSLSPEDMQRLDEMNDGNKYCWNPVNAS